MRSAHITIALLTAIMLMPRDAQAEGLVELSPIEVPREAFETTESRIEPDIVRTPALTPRQFVQVCRNLDITLYDLPYSRTLSIPRWGRLWANTAVLMAGGITTMVILEALPEDATAWNRAANSSTPLFKRWVNHVKAGPVWDGDKFIFNWILHPYAGAAYYMSARSCGFNCWGSFLYSFGISSIFWEYGFEAFNEIPSVQDLVVTPVIGSVIGECFYKIKRHIVANDYRLLGTPVLGYIVAFICDPVNECLGYFRGDQKRTRSLYKKAHQPEFSGGLSLVPSTKGLIAQFNISVNF